MNTEDRLRAAFDARVRTVDPDALAPLVAPVRTSRSRRRRPVWAVPAVASIVVLVVVVAAAGLGGIMNGSGSHHALSPGDDLRYLMIVRGDGIAEVQDARSGDPVAPVPGRSYVAVAAAGNDTFYLARREGDWRIRLYRTSIRNGSAAEPAPLPAGPIAISPDDVAMSVSPNGDRLAVSGTFQTTHRVTVLATDTGAAHEWTGRTTAYSRYLPAWSVDGRVVAALWWNVRGDIAKAPLLLLDPNRSGDLADGRVLRTHGIQDGPLKGARIESVAFNPDGRTMTALLSGPSALTVLSATTGRPSGKVIRLSADFAGTLRLDRSGRHILLIGSGRIGTFDGTRLVWHSNPHEYRDAAW